MQHDEEKRVNGKHSNDVGASADAGRQRSRKKRRKKPWSLGSKILLIIGIALLVAAASIGGYIGWSYYDAAQRYDAVNRASGIDDALLDAILANQRALEELNVDWESLRAINPDIVGWVRVGGTDISYPIVHGTDNDYWLHHSFDGAAISSGSIFLDCECAPDFSSMNNIIYGHNMLNGSMFAQILGFKDQAFLDEGHKVLVITPTHAYILAPAFTYICGEANELRQIDFASQADFQAYIEQLMQQSVTSESVDLDKVDKLFSLVTCSYEANDVRTVLCCVQTDAVTFPTP